jgi:glucosylceramidase
MRIDRRAALKLAGVGAVGGSLSIAGPSIGKANTIENLQWVSTNPVMRWKAQKGLAVTSAASSMFDRHIEVAVDKPRQTISGFGGAFSERGWDALSTLPAPLRAQALADLFSDGGAAFNLCRTPIAANDIARKWYSYAETPGDFALDHFSVANDRATLIPYIKLAKAIRPDLKVWASPWSPPIWMKTNGHYAMAHSWADQPSNGLKPEQQGKEGQDYFIQEDRYFDAYARYFRRYVEEYGKEGINIGMVMPQNEFNSAQPFPSCCWTPEGLARFIPFLGEEMAKTGTDIFFGTLERPDASMLTTVLNDPKAAPHVMGVGIQWGGKGALEDIARRHPGLPIWGSEQECGRGTNDWHYTRYGWDLIKRYFNAGANAWHYWNMAMPTDGLTGWGWPQNALVSVDTESKTYRLTNDYWLMKHLSAWVKPGAQFVPATSFLGFENQLAFRNPNGDLVIVIQNDLATSHKVGIAIMGKQITPTLPADSLNTVLIPAAMLA